MEEKERVIEGKLQKLITRIKVVGYKEHWIRLTREYVNELQQRGVYCVDRFVQRLKRCTNGKDPREYWEILLEGRFAIILARNGFSNIHIEYSNKGMDIKANWNRKTVYFEVTRKRPSEDDKRFSYPGAGPYWVKLAESEDIIGKIQGKLLQLKPGEINIVVVWSNTPAWNQDVLGETDKYIKQEICDDPNRYKHLSAILFTPGGVNSATLKQFYLFFENDKASKKLGTRLAQKLKSLHERNPKQLKREFEELAASLKQLGDKRNS